MKWLRRFGEARGYTVEKSRRLIFGKEKGYEVIIQFQNAQPQYRLTFSAKEGAENCLGEESLREYLCRLNDKYSFVNSASYKDNTVTITLIGKGRRDQENLPAIVEEVIGFCVAGRFSPCCRFCGQAVPVNVYSVRGQCMTMCPGCFEELHNSLLAAGSQKKPVNLAAGIVGALAGSLIGVILWVVIYRLGYVAGITGFVMSVCCIKGFEKLGGGLNRPGLWLSLFLAVLMLLVGEFAALAMDLHSALTGFGYEISYLECLQALPGIVNGEILAGAARDLVMGYVFMAIASISFIQQVNRSIHMENEALRLA